MDPVCAQCNLPVDPDGPYELWMAGLTTTGRDEHVHIGCSDDYRKRQTPMIKVA